MDIRQANFINYKTILTGVLKLHKSQNRRKNYNDMRQIRNWRETSSGKPVSLFTSKIKKSVANIRKMRNVVPDVIIL